MSDCYSMTRTQEKILAMIHDGKDPSGIRSMNQPLRTKEEAISWMIHGFSFISVFHYMQANKWKWCNEKSDFPKRVYPDTHRMRRVARRLLFDVANDIHGTQYIGTGGFEVHLLPVDNSGMPGLKLAFPKARHEIQSRFVPDYPECAIGCALYSTRPSMMKANSPATPKPKGG